MKFEAYIACIIAFLAASAYGNCQRRDRSAARSVGRRCGRKCGEAGDHKCKEPAVCVCDHQCGFSCINVERKCRLPPAILHMQEIRILRQPSRGSSFVVERPPFRYNDQAVYVCRPGYTFKSRAKHWCHGRSGWTGIGQSRCVRACKSRDHTNSNEKVSLRDDADEYCEDGWTEFQRRFNGSVDFYRNWTEYKNGFGSYSGEFWLGLERIHKLTAGRQCRLRIDLEDFQSSRSFAEYSYFAVENEADNYRLRLAGYSGDAGDSMLHNDTRGNLNGMQFSTKDRNNDNFSGSCAGAWSGAWWFNNCFYAHLNGEWAETQSVLGENILWHTWRGYDVPLKATSMKLRCD